MTNELKFRLNYKQNLNKGFAIAAQCAHNEKLRINKMNKKLKII